MLLLATTQAAGTSDVLTHHLTAFGSNDLDAMLQACTEESQVLTLEGQRQGLAAIRALFADWCGLVPRGCGFEQKQRTIVDNAT